MQDAEEDVETLLLDLVGEGVAVVTEERREDLLLRLRVAARRLDLVVGVASAVLQRNHVTQFLVPTVEPSQEGHISTRMRCSGEVSGVAGENSMPSVNSIRYTTVKDRKNCATLVRSRQSMQFERSTPCCSRRAALSRDSRKEEETPETASKATVSSLRRR